SSCQRCGLRRISMLRRITYLVLATALLAACGSIGGGQPAREVTMAMPYIPNVQFAPFYLADKKGYYAAEGLKVTFDYNFQTDVIERVTQNNVQFGNGSGPDVLLARSQGRPIVSVATYSQKFPVVFFSKPQANIKAPADLKGKTVGIPGHYGASYIGL